MFSSETFVWVMLLAVLTQTGVAQAGESEGRVAPLHGAMLGATGAAPHGAPRQGRPKMAHVTEFGSTYVLMVSSVHPPFAALNVENVKAFNATPFDGIAELLRRTRPK